MTGEIVYVLISHRTTAYSNESYRSHFEGVFSSEALADQHRVSLEGEQGLYIYQYFEIEEAMVDSEVS